MEFLKFERLLGKYLSPEESSSKNMEIIGDFLGSDVCSTSQWFLEWLKSDSDVMGGNLIYLLKYNDSIIITNSLTNGKTTLTKEQLFQILTQWAQAYNAMPKHLLVKKVNDQFIFEATYD